MTCTRCHLLLALCVTIVIISAQSAPAPAKDEVRIWEEPISLPSYRLDPPDPSPMFYTGASYQGAQKRIYPYPLMDKITGVRERGSFKAVNLENEYIRLSVLPEIGGRLFSAVDKTDNYDMFYHQHVIKPALIGMLGAWISGGIEWCVFHHHRNSTFMPVDYTMADNPDGSKTLWFGETERRHRMRWIIGLTLYPDKSYIEATVRMFNRTAVPNSILYWANVAVHVNDDYQVIFPPSVQVATYHSKNAFTTWPISTGMYRGTNYRYVDQKQYDKALEHFRRAAEYPDNLAIERPDSDRRGPQVAYYTAVACAGLGHAEQAGKFYRQSAGQRVPGDWSESRFYQALALRSSGEKERADKMLEELVVSGTRRLSGEGTVDFFAKFGEQQTRQGQRTNAHYELGLGLLSQGRIEEAKNQFEQALNFNAGLTWARYHLSSLSNE